MMRSLLRTAAFLAASCLAACGGGGGSTSSVPPVGTVSWLAALRSEPTDVRLSLSSPTMQYMYIDSGATNGVYPSPGAFTAELQAANPGLLTGACSKLAHMFASTMQFTDWRGIQAPSYVVFFTPLATGSCAQDVSLGAEGTRTFTVTVTP